MKFETQKYKQICHGISQPTLQHLTLANFQVENISPLSCLTDVLLSVFCLSSWSLLLYIVLKPSLYLVSDASLCVVSFVL